MKWSVSGKLPTGLKLTASNGKITGKPTKAGTFSFKITAKNSAGSVSKTLKIVIKDAKPVIKTSSLKAGTVGTSYTATLSANGSSVKWSVSGKLPTGLKLTASNGKITGKPTKAGTFSFKVTAKNSAGSVSKTLKIVIKDAKPVIKTSSLKSGTVGTSYTATLSTTGSRVKWSISSGKLPTGLKLTASNGKITGKPTKSGTFSFTVMAKNSAGSVKKTLKITIAKTKAKTSSFADFYSSVKAKILGGIENYSNDEPENDLDVTPNDDNNDLTTPEEEISGETPENSAVDQEIKNNAVNAELTLINSENVNINVDDKFYAASGTDLIFKISTWTDGDGNNIEPEKYTFILMMN